VNARNARWKNFLSRCMNGYGARLRVRKERKGANDALWKTTEKAGRNKIKP